MRTSIMTCLAVAAVLSTTAVDAIPLDVTSSASIKQAASTVAWDLMKIYTGNYTGDVPGNLPDPYYWWQCGAMFGSMIDYWYYTGDTTYNAVVTQGLLHQVGDDKNYMPVNQSRSLGNDDQGFWGMTAMAAAETKFPDPPAGQPQWLALAQAVFNTQVVRWNMESCGGGLKWQIFTFNNGYNYKNSISNGAFFNLAARLAVYTGNKTYAEWATKTWGWMEAITLIDATYNVYDGSDDKLNCTEKDRTQWTYNAGIFLSGAAFMYNLTDGSDIWRGRVEGMLTRTLSVFFDQSSIMYEVCESSLKCNEDQYSFKAYLSRWMAATSEIAPFTADRINPALKASAIAAAKQCSAGARGSSCGARWTQGEIHDRTTGVGQQMAALEVIQSLLVHETRGLVTNATGGTSVGDANAGKSTRIYEAPASEIKTADKAGAGILTVLIVGGLLMGTWFMLTDAFTG